MSCFSLLGHNYEVKTSRKGRGSIARQALDALLRKAEGVADQYRSLSFLFPLNEIDARGEARLKEFSLAQRIPVKWFGPKECDNLLRASERTNKELFQLIKNAFEKAVRGDGDDQDDEEGI